MCKLLCFEGKRCKNMQTHFKKHGIWMILWKKGRAGTGCMSAVAMAPCTVLQSFIDVYCPSLSNFPPLTYKDWLACQQTRSSCSTPPLAPVTDPKKPAVWAATPREAGWIHHLPPLRLKLHACSFQTGTGSSQLGSFQPPLGPPPSRLSSDPQCPAADRGSPLWQQEFLCSQPSKRRNEPPCQLLELQSTPKSRDP